MRATLPKLLLLSTAFLLTNCSSYNAPESVTDKMSRYKPNLTNENPVPAIKLWKVTMTPPKEIKVKSKSHEEKVNHKTLYFTALYNQHSEFKSYLTDEKEQTLNHCPAFHNTFLKIKKPNGLSTTKIISQAKATKLPIDAPLYALPAADMGSTVKMALSAHNTQPDLITKAVKAHAKRTLTELKEFCHTGTSLNYYNFANIITHIENNRASFHREKEKSMQSLLKTTIYSNLAILKNLDQVTSKGRFPASSQSKKSQSSQEVDNVLETSWTATYFDSL